MKVEVEWFKVEDKLPEPYTDVWIVYKGRVYRARYGNRTFSDGVFRRKAEDRGLTHWAYRNEPVPDPPETEDGDDAHENR